MTVLYFNKRKPLPHAIKLAEQSICTQLITLRTNAGISQTELAYRCGLYPHQIKQYETGAIKISANKLKVITDTLNCDIGDFYDKIKNLIQEKVA